MITVDVVTVALNINYSAPLIYNPKNTVCIIYFRSERCAKNTMYIPLSSLKNAQIVLYHSSKNPCSDSQLHNIFFPFEPHIKQFLRRFSTYTTHQSVILCTLSICFLKVSIPFVVLFWSGSIHSRKPRYEITHDCERALNLFPIILASCSLWGHWGLRLPFLKLPANTNLHSVQWLQTKWVRGKYGRAKKAETSRPGKDCKIAWHFGSYLIKTYYLVHSK